MHDYDIWTMNPDGSDLRNLTNTSTVTEACPSWSPDHKRLAYIRLAGATGASAQLWTMDSDGSDQAYFKQEYPSDGTIGWMPLQYVAWAPNGKWLALSVGFPSAATYGHVALVEVSSHKVRSLYSAEGIIYGLSWRPDSEVIAFDNSNTPPGPGDVSSGVGVASGSLVTLRLSGPDARSRLLGVRRALVTRWLSDLLHDGAQLAK